MKMVNQGSYCLNKKYIRIKKREDGSVQGGGGGGGGGVTRTQMCYPLESNNL